MPPNNLPNPPRSQQELIEYAIWLAYQDTMTHYEQTGQFVFNGHILTEEEITLVQQGQPLPARLLTPGKVVIPSQLDLVTPGKLGSPNPKALPRGRTKKRK